MAHYLGLDLSTQQLKAIVVSSDLTVVSEAKVDFDADFGSQYGITKGVHINQNDNSVYAPVAMWLEALDLVLARLSATTDMAAIKGISGSCQQHGSVYWSLSAEEKLKGLAAGSSRGLKEQLDMAFSHPWAPNWQDGSTQRECDQFDAEFGSPAKLAEITGSAAHHRFTGPQIMRLKRLFPDMYSNTSRISLVSSFLASLLLGHIAPIDISDACGMNLWDISANDWSLALLHLTTQASSDPAAAAEIRAKLGSVRRDGGGSMGSLSPYFVIKYGMSLDCQIAPFTGDNPATILALPLRPMDAIISLGTSTTFLMSTPYYKPDPAYHFFNHPTTPGQYMFMLCYKNGGLAREKVRDALPSAADKDGDAWASFNSKVTGTSPLHMGNEEDKAKLGLYFYLNEIVPNIRAGTWRFECGPSGDNLTQLPAEKAWDPELDARAIVESQALSIKLRSKNLVHSPVNQPSFPPQPRRIYLVGGGSLNPAISKVMGDVLGGLEGVYRLDVGGNACALGGAYKAVWALERAEGETFDELIGKRWKEEAAIEKVSDGYDEKVFAKYEKVLGAFEQMETRLLAEEGR
ncbi:D-xylulose kinase [Ceratocystis lukuohia]|uniref:Xylulose kinase n=1 Tax=Ceratocystis lukuohia TaxID=2019550 RepID=A0ABR4MDJ3_9PEZI